MKEDYLHYVWKFQLLKNVQLYTSEGEKVVVEFPGNHNDNAGPDFLEAKIKIGQELWFGSVELHLNTSDWTNHKHHKDAVYNNVILHVVYNNDKQVLNQNGYKIPLLDLSEYIEKNHYDNYKRFISTKKVIPCENLLHSVTPIILNSFVDSLTVGRLEKKTNEILKELDVLKGDWEEVMHLFLCKHLGMKVNGDAMLELARRTPWHLLKKEENKEALLFGQSGMLEKQINDRYYQQLQDQYKYIRSKYILTPMSETNWKYFKLRPYNFPTIRIAQLASLYQQENNFFALVRKKLPIRDVENIFSVSTSGYWSNHYVFGKTSGKTINQMGNMAINNLLINVIVPMSFAYGKTIDDSSYVDYSIELLKAINGEKNRTVNYWQQQGFEIFSAYQTQALIELDAEMCRKKRCLHCRIGNELLKM